MSTGATSAQRLILLMLDFPGRRPEAHLSDLRLEEHGFECRYPLTHPLPSEIDSDAYARELYARLPKETGSVLAVLSYCATAPLAMVMATLARNEDQPLPILFFDPSRCHECHLVNGYSAVVRQIDRAETAGAIPLLDIAKLLPDPALLVGSVAEDLRLRARLALAGDGFAENEVSGPLDHIVQMYLDWLTYLVAVHYSGSAGTIGDVLQIFSHKHEQGVDWLGVPGAPTVRLDCDRPSLASDPAARGVVLDFLAGIAAGSTTTGVTHGH